MKITINAAQQEAQDMSAKASPPIVGTQEVFKAGTLVESKLDGLIILISDGAPYMVNRFCGTVINTGKQHPIIGEYQNDWVKECFDKFVGNIVLEQ